MNYERFGRALDFLRRRKRNYQLAFGSPAGQQVLIDLARLCRANETCFHEDPRLHAVAEGRREVWLYIQKHLNLPSEQLLAIFGGHEFKPILAEQKEEEDDNG
jgi:hypothetical protein